MMCCHVAPLKKLKMYFYLIEKKTSHHSFCMVLVFDTWKNITLPHGILIVSVCFQSKLFGAMSHINCVHLSFEG